MAIAPRKPPAAGISSPDNGLPDRRLGRAIGVVAVVAAVLAGPAGSAAAMDHTVEPGESLSVIARNHGVSTSELADENGISDLHLVRVGQVLQIPGVEPTIYTVQPGDSLGAIANRVGVNRSGIIALNGISDPNLLRVGQELKIPGDGPIDPAAGYNRLPGRLREHPDRLRLIPSFEKWAAHYGVPADLLMAMAYRESGWQAGAKSNKDAIGIGQLLPNTAQWVANDLIKIPELDPYDPDDNIRMSARLLQWLIGFMGGENSAIAGYYQGPGSVRARGFFDDTHAYIDNVQVIRNLFGKS